MSAQLELISLRNPWVRRSKSTPPTKQRTGPTPTPEGRAPAGQDKRVATTPGYIDIWAGLVLRGNRMRSLGTGDAAP